MYAPSGTIVPQIFRPHSNLSDATNRNIVQSEVEGGVYLRDLADGAAIEIETRNHIYTLVRCGDRDALLCGHPEFCPEPVQVRIHGSTWGGTMLKDAFVGRSMHLEFRHPAYAGPITTSRIVEVRPMEQQTAAARRKGAA